MPGRAGREYCNTYLDNSSTQKQLPHNICPEPAATPTTAMFQHHHHRAHHHHHRMHCNALQHYKAAQLTARVLCCCCQITGCKQQSTSQPGWLLSLTPGGVAWPSKCLCGKYSASIPTKRAAASTERALKGAKMHTRLISARLMNHQQALLLLQQEQCSAAETSHHTTSVIVECKLHHQCGTIA